jgi:hypothetical protein
MPARGNTLEPWTALPSVPWQLAQVAAKLRVYSVWAGAVWAWLRDDAASAQSASVVLEMKVFTASPHSFDKNPI